MDILLVRKWEYPTQGDDIMIMELRKKAQITIPKELITSLGLKEGDQMDIREKDGIIQIIPVAVYPKKYVDDLKAEISCVKKNIENGKQPVFHNVDDLFKHLDL